MVYMSNMFMLPRCQEWHVSWSISYFREKYVRRTPHTALLLLCTMRTHTNTFAVFKDILLLNNKSIRRTCKTRVNQSEGWCAACCFGERMLKYSINLNCLFKWFRLSAGAYFFVFFSKSWCAFVTCVFFSAPPPGIKLCFLHLSKSPAFGSFLTQSWEVHITYKKCKETL